MVKAYPCYICLLVIAVNILVFAASCKKDKKEEQPVITNFATLGLYEYMSGNNRRVFIAITKVGDVTVNYGSVFDTGSTGMTIDAHGILPDNMITNSGIVVPPGDSVNVKGITVTSQQAEMAYGGGGSTETREYGNLAYAKVTIGNANGSVTTTRIPIFLYYKVVDITNNKTLPEHSNDVFGVGPGFSYASNKIGSPLSYFTMPANVTNGFKLAKFPAASFTNPDPTYVPGLLTIGLTPTDLNSGFIMHNLSFNSVGGYSPNIPAKINYNGTDVNALLLFDTGDPSITFLANNAAPANLTLPAGTPVSLTTNSGFTYQYTTNNTTNTTQVLRQSGDPRSIYSIGFFVDNQFLMDYQNHRIGLKNN